MQQATENLVPSPEELYKLARDLKPTLLNRAEETQQNLEGLRMKQFKILKI